MSIQRVIELQQELSKSNDRALISVMKEALKREKASKKKSK